MSGPEQGIPRKVLESARCIAIIPGDVKFAVMLDGKYGRGVATCRTGQKWSAPMFVAIEGDSVGYQTGGAPTDIVLVFMADHAMESLLGEKFKLGVDNSVAAGPLGRRDPASVMPTGPNTSLEADLHLTPEILLLFAFEGRLRRSEPERSNRTG